jgi:hypothetical protein
MKVLLITECQYHDVPDSDSVKFVYYRPETNDYRIASAGVEAPGETQRRVAVFKPIVLGHMEKVEKEEERFCVVPGTEVSDTLVNIFEGVRKENEALRRDLHTCERNVGYYERKITALYGELGLFRSVFIGMPFWERLVFLFKGEKCLTGKYTQQRPVK